jgi:dTDP-4-amino-4,6-dideoxygalactose transaminase
MIPYARQDIIEDDRLAVERILKSDWLTQGPTVPSFESKVASYCGVRDAVATNSATSALHVACLALGLGPGDWLWTSPNSFVASANCGLYCGAKIDFVDIEMTSYNMCSERLEEKLVEAERRGVLPKIVIPVHFAGQAPNMLKIKELAERYNFYIIEDASHAIGARYSPSIDPLPKAACSEKPDNNKKLTEEQTRTVGNCHFSDVTVFSFHPVKIITSGEGGMAVTNDRFIAEKMRVFRSHGITRDPELMEKTDEGPWLYNQVELGFNYRMTDIHAALGISQLGRLDQYIAQRHLLAGVYHEHLRQIPITLPEQKSNCYSAMHLYPVLLSSAAQRREVFDFFQSHDVKVNVHYFPIHLQPYFKTLGFKTGDFTNSENYYERTLTLPMYPKLPADSQKMVIDLLKEALANSRH